MKLDALLHRSAQWPSKQSGARINLATVAGASVSFVAPQSPACGPSLMRAAGRFFKVPVARISACGAMCS
jgi:hypothetical protein